MSSLSKSDRKAVLDFAAWSFNITTSVGIIMVNKALMATHGFSFGIGESSRTKPSKHRKRPRVEEDQFLQTITDSLAKLAEAIEKTSKSSEVPDDLWAHVSALPGFLEVDLLNYLTYLCDNPSKARAFMMVPMSSQMVMAAKFFQENP